MYGCIRWTDVCVVYLPCTDAPLTPANMLEALQKVLDWNAFCKCLHLLVRPSKMETVEFFIGEPYFEASWKKIALALYHSNEEEAIDDLFQYMKSPTGKFH